MFRDSEPDLDNAAKNPPPDNKITVQKVLALLQDKSVRPMALYGAIGGVLGMVASVLLWVILGLLFRGSSDGLTISDSAFGRHDDLLGSIIFGLLFAEVIALLIVGVHVLVSLGIGLGVRRVSTFQDYPDGVVAVAVALGLCLLGTPVGILNPLTLVLLTGGAYLVATYRHTLFRNVTLILLFLPIIVPVGIIWLLFAVVTSNFSTGDATSTLSQWEVNDRQYKQDIADRERAAGRG